MGTGNRVYEHAVIGHEPQDVSFAGEVSRLVIGNENVIREGVTINRATGADQATLVGSRNYLMAYVHVAHNCEIGDRVGIANSTVLAGHVRVENDVYISGYVAIAERCRIGRWALVGGLSKITQDILPFCMADGRPLDPGRTEREGLAARRHPGGPDPEPQARLPAVVGAWSEPGGIARDAVTSGRSSGRRADRLYPELDRGFCRAERRAVQRTTRTDDAQKAGEDTVAEP